MDEDSVVGKIQIGELLRIFATLGIMDYYNNLLDLLCPHEEEDTGKKVDIKDVFRVINSCAFLLSLPLRTNNHPTYINLLLLKAVLIVYMKDLLS